MRRFWKIVRFPGRGAYTAEKFAFCRAFFRLRPRSIPVIAMRPLVGSRTPRIILMVVVFPAPLGPSRPRISCVPSSKESPSTATSFPYCFERFATARIGEDIEYRVQNTEHGTQGLVACVPYSASCVLRSRFRDIPRGRKCQGARCRRGTSRHRQDRDRG